MSNIVPVLSAGAVFLSSLAVLQESREWPGEQNNVVIVDALFLSTGSDGEPLSCSLRYVKKNDELVTASAYYIFAKVTRPLLH